ncbi:class I SAM-dependent methyltransferase [Zhihengliuella sp.]|uniref:class I SAM-dependent methyltransferase n=1 Tax=Zhihengliuella sp. TaxID=1954483 RepID=UPI002810F740|nr:class I SAM-dependent methyltransferase [Zhihengliuella sp.]
MAGRNWFETGGEAYAAYRPEYPQALADWLAESTADAGGARELAVDVGCGSGQLTALLAERFERVIGVDPSSGQIASARRREGVEYRVGPAEALPVPDGAAGLITAAQAAHWFDLDRFYAEARRIAAPGALVALIGYGLMRFDHDGDDPAAPDAVERRLAERFDRFYAEEMGPYWPPERRIVEAGYTTVDFPFQEIDGPRLRIELRVALDAFLGYLSTWSAVARAREAGEEDLLAAFRGELAELWGERARTRPISWPLHLRVGSVGSGS